jgi:sec-independent protein translocase protein TatA
MFQGLTGWHAVIILAIILLLFGAPKLPALAKSLGQSMKIFKSEVKTSKDEESAASETPSTAQSTTAQSTTAQAPAPADERTEGSQTQPKP